MRRGPRATAAALALTALLVVAGAGLLGEASPWSIIGRAEAERYETSAGETRTIDLGGGASIKMNPETEIEVRRRDERTDVLMTRGAIFVQKPRVGPSMGIAHAATRMEAEDADFEVRVAGLGALVAVKRGEIRLVDGAGPAREIRAGKSGGTTGVHAQDGSAQTTGMLPLNDTTVDEAVAVLNAHNNRKITFGDASIGELRMSGAFRTDDPAGFARGVAALHGLEVSGAADESLKLLRRRK